MNDFEFFAAEASSSTKSLGRRENSKLPPHLADAIGKGHAKEDVPLLVAQLETLGYRVQVVRLQLGRLQRKGWGETRVIYETKEQKQEP